jgi:hypothetical protein
MDEIKNIWTCMVYRKDRPSNKGVGFEVCQEWSDPTVGFEKFKSDMGPRPSGEHRVLRKDPFKGWSPDNCHWGLLKELKRRNEKPHEFAGHSLTAPEWARRLGMPEMTLRTRLKKMPIDQALLKPVRGDRTNTAWVVRFDGFIGNNPAGTGHDQRHVCTDSSPFDSVAGAHAAWSLRSKHKNAANATMTLFRVTDGQYTPVLIYRGIAQNSIVAA